MWTAARSAAAPDRRWSNPDEWCWTEKYAEGLASLSMTEEQFHAEYSVTVRVTPDRLRGF
ncbi:hypothetical protein ACQP2U_04190 [Nocardia sp. CA-084685]|uniref:hypothetical protein n=1 Tax=Nocardia sp. CA-084685 TaxID=3239970 RepID=UPI003D9925B0